MGGLPRNVGFSHRCQFLPMIPRAILLSSSPLTARRRAYKTGKELCKNPSFSVLPARPCWSLVLPLAKATATAARPFRPTRSARLAVLWPVQPSPRSSTVTSARARLSVPPVAHCATTQASVSAATDLCNQILTGAPEAHRPDQKDHDTCRRKSSLFWASRLPALPAARRGSTRPTPTVRLSARASVRPSPMSAVTMSSAAQPLAAQQVRCATTCVFANDLTRACRVSCSSGRPDLSSGRLFHACI